MKVFNNSSSSSSSPCMNLSKMFLFCVCLSKLWIISTMLMSGGNLDFSFNNQGNNNAILLFASAETTVDNKIDVNTTTPSSSLVGIDPLETWKYIQTGPMAYIFDGMEPIETENNNNNNKDENKNLSSSSFEEKQKQFYSRFINLSKVLVEALDLPEAKDQSEDQRKRIFYKDIPVYVHLINTMHNMKRRKYVKSYIKQDCCSDKVNDNNNNKNSPLLVGFLAPCGYGKTTFAHSVNHMCQSEGLNCVTLSIDDFYLTRADRNAFYLSHLDHPYIRDRGLPGTHDIPLIYDTFQKLKYFKDGDDVRVPKFAKYLFNGDGDRLPYSEWTRVQKKPDLVLLEGWFIGFESQPDNLPIFKTQPDLKTINTWLKDYEKWWSMMETWIVVKCRDFSISSKWMMESEQMVAALKTGEGVPDTIEEFATLNKDFQELYYADLCAGKNSFTKDNPTLYLTLKDDRIVTQGELITTATTT